MRRWLPAVFALFVCALATPAAADPALDRARAAIDSSDYLTARTALSDALARGDNGPDELVEIYRLTATIAAGLGQGSAATDAFERMLALSPKATLPAGTSPKITRPFTVAQTFFKTNAPLQIKVDTAASPPSLTVTIVADPVHMIASARAVIRVDGGAERTLEEPAAPTILFTLPAGRRIDVRVTARDEHGNRLAEVGTADVPVVIVGPAPPSVVVTRPGLVAARPLPPPPPAHHRPVYLAWWLWGGAAVAVAGVGTAYSVGVYDARSDLESLAAAGHPVSDAKPVESRGDRDALYANIAFGTAGAFAVVTAILYVTRDTHTHANEHVVAAPLPGGSAVMLEGRF